MDDVGDAKPQIVMAVASAIVGIVIGIALVTLMWFSSRLSTVETGLNQVVQFLNMQVVRAQPSNLPPPTQGAQP